MENENRDNRGVGFGVILLIEDDAIVMDVGRAMIEKLGYTVLSAATGQEAIDLVNHHEGPIDMAMLDMDLPDMKGQAVFPYLVEARPQMKIVICSGDYMDEGDDRLIPTGVHGYLQKPFALKTLETLLVKHLDRRNEPRVPAMDDFLAVSNQKGVYSIRIIDISQGGMAFARKDDQSDEDALVDVAILMAEKGVNLDDLECRIVSEKPMTIEDMEPGEIMKRKSVSFGRMTKQQFDKLSELINTCAKKNQN